MKTSEVLDLAADAIEKRGWAGRDVEPEEAWGETNDSSPLCLEGGIIAALGGTDVVSISKVDQCPAYRAVQSHLSTSPNYRLYRFNDARGRTAAEVIEVLRATAVIEAAREDAEVREQVTA